LARRPTLWERTSKWARRHRAIVLTAMGLLILAMGALLTFTLLLMAEQKKTLNALKKMEAKEKEARAQEVQAMLNWNRAENNFNSACMGVFQLLFKLQDKQWDDVREMHRVRLVLKEQGINFLKGFIADKDPDPSMRQRSARAYCVMGRIQL